MKKTFILKGLDCANCAAKIERSINRLEGVNMSTVSFITQKLIIDGDDEKMAQIIDKAGKIIKRIEPQAVMKDT